MNKGEGIKVDVEPAIKVDRSLLVASRTPFIFSFVISFFVLCLLVFEWTKSSKLAIVSGILYVSLPEIFVRSSFASMEAFSNLFLCFLLYFYLIQNRYTERRGMRILLFLAGFFAFWVTQKTTVFLVAVVLKELIERKSFRSILNNKIMWGFIAGLVVWCIYGSFLDARDFFQAFFLRQLIFRFFPAFNPSLDQALIIPIYPNIVNLWKQFNHNLGFPFLPLAVLANFYLIKKAKDPEGLLFFWFMVVAILGSWIDFRMTRHLIVGIIPLVVSLSLYGMQLRRGRLLWYLITGCIIINNIFVNYNITKDLNYLTPLPTW